MFARVVRTVASQVRAAAPRVAKNTRRVVASRAAHGVRKTVHTAARKANPSAARTAPRHAGAKAAAVAVGVGAAIMWGLQENIEAGSMPMAGVAGTNSERTFIAVKPDGVERGIVGDIIKRFEAKGFKLVGMKFLHASKAEAEGHYADLKNKPFFPSLVNYFSSGPIVAMVWEGKGAIKTGRVLLGATNPADSAPGTIRGDLCVDIGRNIIHGSDAPDSAKHEIEFWFRENEVVNWTPATAKWVYEKP